MRSNDSIAKIVYIHGKGGSAKEAEHYKKLLSEYDVIGLDYKATTPWEAKKEFTAFASNLKGKDPFILIANSIGAYYSMHSFAKQQISKAFFISPIVDIEVLILKMMSETGVTEKELRESKIIPTPFGEPLRWDYLCYVRDHPIIWETPTYILYGENDALTPYQTILDFSDRIKAELTIKPNGEHWFHTNEDMTFLDAWIKSTL